MNAYSFYGRTFGLKPAFAQNICTANHCNFPALMIEISFCKIESKRNEYEENQAA